VFVDSFSLSAALNPLVQQLLSCNTDIYAFCPSNSRYNNSSSDVYRGPRMVCIFYWVLQLAVGTLKSFSALRCAWINNFILALASLAFSFCFETWLVVEHEKVCVFETLCAITELFMFYELLIALPCLFFSKTRSKICCLIPSG
jgi:hypothetical protein